MNVKVHQQLGPSAYYLTYGSRNYKREISYSPDLVRFLKGSCRLANRKGGSTSAPSPSKFLPDIWTQKLKCEYMYLPGACPFSKRQLSAFTLRRWKYICNSAHPRTTWHMDQNIKIRKYVSTRILFLFESQLSALTLLRWKYICYSSLPSSYLPYGSRN